MNDKEMRTFTWVCKKHNIGHEGICEQCIRQEEREKILNFIGKLKISDEFHEFWKNEVMSTGEDVLRNTLDMVIREIREEKSACGKPSCDMGSCDSICEKEEVKK